MLADSLTDDALAFAKNRCHPAVERAHVLAAILVDRRVRWPGDVPTLTPDDVLPPVGTAWQTPPISDDAAALLAECVDGAAAGSVGMRIIAERTAPPPGDTVAGPATVVAPPGDVARPGDPSSTSTTASTTTTTATTALPTPDGAPVDTSAPLAPIDMALAKLHRLIGLDAVKQAVASLVEVHRLNAQRAARGLPQVPVGLHLVFTGNPGTGKTTVARIVADVYRCLGLLKQGHLVEVQRADLVAGYIGQTAIKVEEVVNSALGGVLFIDEAYALAPSSERDYGSEAIATLLKMMEDHRNELAVIAAGYGREMVAFVNANSGLRSRFQRFIDFADYTDDELLQIFHGFAADNQLEVPPDVDEALLRAFTAAPAEMRNGNGRFARNLFEDMYARMALRVGADGEITDDELAGFAVADVPTFGASKPGSAPGYI